MSTWQLFSDAANSFRWETCRQQLQDEDAVQQDTESRRLPSMPDLLLLGCSKLVDNGRSNFGSPPMFLTGLGKSVVVKQSSVAKARTILGDGNDSVAETGHLDLKENGHPSLKQMSMLDSNESASMMKSTLQDSSEKLVKIPKSMFQTGSGKPVHISPAGLIRAKNLLDIDKYFDGDSLHGVGRPGKGSISTELLDRESPFRVETDPLSTKTKRKVHTDFVPSALKPPPVKFRTAGGKSVSVSTDALLRARNLLGNLEYDSFLDDESTADPLFSVPEVEMPTCAYDCSTLSVEKDVGSNNNSWTCFVSPLKSNACQNWSLYKSEKVLHGNNLILEFDAEAGTDPSSKPDDGLDCGRKHKRDDSYHKYLDCMENAVSSEVQYSRRPSNGALVDISNTVDSYSVDISNTVDSYSVDNKHHLVEKNRLRVVSSVSPFKKPRTSFVTPLKKNGSSIANVSSRLAPPDPCSKQRICLRYPFQLPRPYLKEYVQHPPSLEEKLENIPDHVKRMNPIAAECYAFQNESPSECVGPEAFQRMLSHSGASMQYLTTEWVSNHYKWIVWKLACYERSYPSKFSGKLLTISNVLEELRYRYDREVNHGHRSAIKKILDGDALPSSMMVLCISSIGKSFGHMSEHKSALLERDGERRAPNIELTDGWYSVQAQLDELLYKKLASGKLFLGQKLRIWGARLCGWVGPVSPFEASQTTSLLLHMNGTYRCHWDERLGFCKSAGEPLAFRCIKGAGGAVSRTLVGVTRIYPVLYRERLTNGGFIVRSERAEAKALYLYNQRRDVVAEGIISASGKGMEYDVRDDNESAGAKLMKLLETVAEPEILMAGLSSEQLTSFASYKAKLEVMRQTEMQRSIEKTLEAAGLVEREVTPFLRVKVVGLTKKCSLKCSTQKGMITIWNPTEKQKSELGEGLAYTVGGLVPSTLDSDVLYFQSRGSSSSWLPLSPLTMETFVPFFTCRLSTTISCLGEIPLSSEFDIAAFVVYVGEVYICGHHHKQWVFVTDGSTTYLSSRERHVGLLAINFSSPDADSETSASVNSNIVGSVVGFCNLIKRPSDQVNGLCVAEGTENSDYFLNYDHANRSHLKDAAASVFAWANTSGLIIEKLKERIFSVIRNSKNECR